MRACTHGGGAHRRVNRWQLLLQKVQRGKTATVTSVVTYDVMCIWTCLDQAVRGCGSICWWSVVVISPRPLWWGNASQGTEATVGIGFPELMQQKGCLPWLRSLQTCSDHYSEHSVLGSELLFKTDWKILFWVQSCFLKLSWKSGLMELNWPYTTNTTQSVVTYVTIASWVLPWRFNLMWCR